MTIDIRRGPLGARSTSIAFAGVSSEGSSSVNVINNITNIEARVSADPTKVDIVDLNATENNGGVTTLELTSVHYTDWRDADNNTFANAGDVVNHIVDLKDQFIKLNTQRTVSAGSSTTVSFASNTPFEYKAQFDNGLDYYWNENDFHSTVTVSNFDHRKISGIVTIAGTYVYNLEVRIPVGIVTVPITLDVV